MALHRNSVLSLYRVLVKEGSKFKNYNFREYSKRRLRAEFEEHRHETNEEKILSLISKGQKELESLRRQVLVNNLYVRGPSIVVDSRDKRKKRSS